MVDAAVAAPQLVAECSDVRPFARLLRGIGLRHNAVLTITPAGFEATVEEVKSLCATAWIPTNIFSAFTFAAADGEPACFEISLDALLLCLNIFGNAGPAGAGPAGFGGRGKRRWAGEGEAGEGEDAGGGAGGARGRGAAGAGGGAGAGAGGRTGMRMTWAGPGFPLSVVLQDERGPTTACELRTMEPEELVNQAFDNDDRAVYLIIKAEWFRDALVDLPPSCAKVTFDAVPRDTAPGPPPAGATASSEARAQNRGDKGSFAIHAEGDFGHVQFDYPNDKQVMDVFECASHVSFSYNAAHVALLGRALQHSTKVCLQIEHSGFLCVQVMMPIPEDMPADRHNGILEFKMNALDDDI